MLNDLFPSILLNVSKFLKTEDEILLQSSIDNYKHVLSVKILKNACAAQSYICFFSRRFSLMLCKYRILKYRTVEGLFLCGLFFLFFRGFQVLGLWFNVLRHTQTWC